MKKHWNVAIACEILDGLQPAVATAGQSPNANDPRRRLRLIRAETALRARQPLLMVRAFEALVEHLPADAPVFFRDALGWLETSDAPLPIREMVREYCDRWSAGQRLH